MSKPAFNIKNSFITFTILFLLTACGGGGSDKLPEKDTIPPLILTKSPDNVTIDVSIFDPIVVTFNEAIKTVNENDILLLKYQTNDPNNFSENLQAIDRVKVAVLVNNKTLTITPVPGSSNGFVAYQSESRYKLTLQNITDISNNPLTTISWDFATTTIPNAKNILPLQTETVSRANEITIIFSEEMDQTSLESSIDTGFKLEDLGLISAATLPTAVIVQDISMSYDITSNTATYTLPGSSPLLNANSNYRATLTNAKDLKGNIAAPISSEFKTNNLTTNTKLQTQPSQVNAEAHYDRIDLSWIAAPPLGINKTFTYNIYVSNDNVSYTLLTNTGPISTLSYTDTNIVVGKSYYYAVTANSPNGFESNKVFNNNSAVMPQALLSYIGAPTTKASDTSVSIGWTKTANAVSYNLYVKINNTATFSLLNKTPISSSLTSFTHSSNTAGLADPLLAVVNGSSYIYKISVINANGDEGTQSAASLIANPVSPPTIISFTANPGSVVAGQSSVLTAVFSNGKGTISGSGPDIILGTATTNPQTFKTTVTPTATNFSYTLNVVNAKNVSATPVTINVPIKDPGIISFALPTSEVSETLDTVLLSVTRSSGDGPVSINYQTNPGGTATAGKDYIAQTTPTTVTFPDTITQIDIPITIIKDLDPESVVPETFTVTLSSPTNGATLDAAKSTHLVNIIDNDILSLSYGIKLLKFNWTSYPGAIIYKLYKIDSSGFNPVGGNISVTNTTVEISVHNHDWNKTRYVLDACNNIDCIRTNEVTTFNATAKQDTKTIGYFKASNGATKDNFGVEVALSGDSQTMAVSSAQHSGLAGAVYMYSRNPVNGDWVEQSIITASNAEANDLFGTSLALSKDGLTLVVGAIGEASLVTKIITSSGFPTTPDTALADETGAVYVYTRAANTSSSSWTQQAYFKASNAGLGDKFGAAVAISADGDTIAVASTLEDNGKSGLFNLKNYPYTASQESGFRKNSGVVYIFLRDTLEVWSQRAYIKPSNPSPADLFGLSLSLSGDGLTLAVGSSEDNDAVLVDNTDNSPTTDPNALGNAGAAYLFTRPSKTGLWKQTAYVKASNTGQVDSFGRKVSLSDDGMTLAVSTRNEGSNTNRIVNNTGFPTQASDTVKQDNTGAVYIYNRNTADDWSMKAYIKASNAQTTTSLIWPYFGWSMSLSGDGKRLAVGTSREDNDLIGVTNFSGFPTANVNNNVGAQNSGAVFVFVINSAGDWEQQSYVKASNREASDYFGSSVALGGRVINGIEVHDGSSLAVGAPYEDSDATTIVNNNIVPITNNLKIYSGAVYLY